MIMKDEGFLMLPNSFFESNYWKEKYKSKLDKGDALLDLIRMVRYGDGCCDVVVNDTTIKINKGEKAASYGYLANRWKWGKSAVFRFIDELCSENIIAKREEKGITILAVTTMDRGGTANGTMNETVFGTVNGTGNTTDNQEVTSSSGTALGTGSGTALGTANGTNKNIVYKEYSNTKNIYIGKTKKYISITDRWLDIPISERNTLFKESVYGYKDKYEKEMLDDFIVYWGYYENGDKTMKFEEVKSKKFHTGRRLATWNSNNKKRKERFNKPYRSRKTLDFGRSNATMDISNMNYDE